MGGDKYSANPGLAAAWPEAYASMGITAELVAERYRRLARGAGRVRGGEPRARGGRAGARALRGRDRPGRRRAGGARGREARDARRSGSSRTTACARDTTFEALARLKPAFKADGTRHRRQLLADDRRRRGGAGRLGGRS